MVPCFTIGAFQLVEFIALNFSQIRSIFGDVPILVSDDESSQSPRIQKLCEKHGITYLKSNIRRGHFAGDFQAIINALQFAKAMNADVAVKVSQRFILKSPHCKDVLEEAFANPDICFALPGKMSPRSLRIGGSAGFTLMPILTDIICLRVGCVEPEELIKDYKEKCENEHFRWSQWVESTCASWKDGRFKDRTWILEAFTNHQPNMERLYLRRNQDPKESYMDLARHYGICGEWALTEWSSLEPHYWPTPLAL